MTTAAIPETGQPLAEALSHLANGEPVVLERDGKPIAALVTLDDLDYFDELEDRLDAELFKKAKEEFEADGGQTIPWEVVKREAGLE